MRLPEPFRTPTAKEEETLKKAAEASERTSSETLDPLQDGEPHRE